MMPICTGENWLKQKAAGRRWYASFKCKFNLHVTERENTLDESSSAFVQDDDTWCWAGEFDKQKLWCRFLNFSQSSKMMMMTMLMMMISPSQRWQWWWWRVWQTKLWGATSSISHSRKHLPAAPRGDSAKRFASDTFSFSKLEKFWKLTPNGSL